jgi:hypothetical protein
MGLVGVSLRAGLYGPDFCFGSKPAGPRGVPAIRYDPSRGLISPAGASLFSRLPSVAAKSVCPSAAGG